MTIINTEFLVDPSGKAPKNLRDSIRRVKHASLGFVHNWNDGDRTEVYETSKDAFENLEYIWGEILRQRDVHQKNPSTWAVSPFRTSLTAPVGRIVKDL